MCMKKYVQKTAIDILLVLKKKKTGKWVTNSIVVK